MRTRSYLAVGALIAGSLVGFAQPANASGWYVGPFDSQWACLMHASLKDNPRYIDRPCGKHDDGKWWYHRRP